LAEHDVVHLAAAMDPGSTAGVLIYESPWAAPFASAARLSGGQPIANGRISIRAIIASIEADEALATEGVRTCHSDQDVQEPGATVTTGGGHRDLRIDAHLHRLDGRIGGAARRTPGSREGDAGRGKSV
jgi:hypothetical protein